MGTALQAAGLPPGAPAERFVLERPEAVRAVHRAHAAAGARILLTATLGAAAPRLAAAGLDTTPARVCRAAVALARGAWPWPAEVEVAGVIGPTGLGACAEGADALAEVAAALAAAGVDRFWVETMVDPAEAQLAVTAARAYGRPVAATLVAQPPAAPGEPWRAADGGPLGAALRRLVLAGADAVGVNCTPGLAHLDSLAGLVAEAAAGRPGILKPGLPPGHLLPPHRFAVRLAPLARAHGLWVGGCCGTTAVHLAALRRALESTEALRC